MTSRDMSGEVGRDPLLHRSGFLSSGRFDGPVSVSVLAKKAKKPDWTGLSNTIWEAWRRTCNPQSSARRLFSSMRNLSTVQVRNHSASANVTPGANFSFVKGTSSQEDYCEMPYAHHTQGHFFSDWCSIPALYPVFSPAKARGFMDIRIPSHYYFSSMPRYTYG